MPVFEFICKSCGHKFEELVLGRGEAAPKCPSCGSSDAKKQFSVFGYNGGASGSSSARSGGGCATCGGGHCSTCH
ncbi:MAG: zinc ribbon domain-containing protein [Firmicutes bacterium]|nr:zinc ribbon domain-containing protein [Bacillota bacterium]